MSSKLALLQTWVVCLFAASASHSLADVETAVQHRAVIDEREPDISNKTAAVIRAEQAPGILTLRCFPEKGLIAEVDFKGSSPRTKANVEIRTTYQADGGIVSEDRAWQTGPSKAIVPNSRQLLEDAMNGSVLHIQLAMDGGPAINMAFQPHNISMLLRKIQSDCPTDAPPPDQTGLAK